MFLFYAMMGVVNPLLTDMYVIAAGIVRTRHIMRLTFLVCLIWRVIAMSARAMLAFWAAKCMCARSRPHVTVRTF
jgi:hypothetical protein